ncbi:hypothetical protein [Desertibaculum subflavum]|uniref:hypothetical protein n=1 Tax=Desertibaculum subflavum TaxID=2268458 RepID=UPI000E65F7BA
MDKELERLRDKLREIETEIERKFEVHGAEMRYRIERNKAIFERGVLDQHRRIKVGLVQFLRRSSLPTLVTAPAVYGLVIPLLALDFAVAAYQLICFPAWGIARIRRSDYIVIDRHRLAYLNGVQKLNCIYCGYANGLIALVREVASRTEQYWCPIRHARGIKGAHLRYDGFLTYGDAEGFRDRLEELRDEVRRL